MDEIACVISQFDLENGATSCMAGSMCAARLFLEQDLSRADLARVLKAGATLYTRWTQHTGETGLQHWKDVVKTAPRYLDDARAVYEANGQFGAAERSASTDLYSDVFASCDNAAYARVAGVITANGGSYMVGKDAQYYYCFDPHGRYGVRRDNEPCGATLRRSTDATAIANYLKDELICPMDQTEFHAVLFAAKPVTELPGR